METGKGARGLASTASQKPPVTNPLFLFCLFLFLICVGCASPGEPIERRPPTPTAVADLAAHQSGNTVALTFTLPHETVQNRPLKQPPNIEILRSISAAPPGTAPAKAVRLPLSPLVTIPSAMVDRYVEQGHVHYVDVLQPNDFAQQTNGVATYVVRTRVVEKKASPDSNLVSLQIYPLPDPIDDLKAQIMAAGAGVTLTWTPPQKTPVGPAPPIQTYRIYRAVITVPGNESEAAPSAAPPSASASNPSKMKAPFTQIAETSAPSYEDKQPQFGGTYAYSVRSVVHIDAHELESSDSNLTTIIMRDIYPPSAPQGLVAVLVPQLGDVPAHLELSWAINPETDVAGYSVYRSEQQGTRGERLNPELLLTPAFRDMSAVAGRTYFYMVTAVDRSGNESSASASVTAAMPAESQ